MKKAWWQDAVIYQVYLRSFYDANHDGIGDIQGVIAKLDYLKDLGVDAIWISPHYDSPMDDNGYDIRHFKKVSPDYGTLEDFKELINMAHQKGIKILTDLVLNHTSDEHPWFEAAKDPTHPKHEHYHDYYIWHKGRIKDDGTTTLPTDWVSWFGGPVWKYNEATSEYYLHIFSEKMPDLNWHNKHMQNDLKAIIKWWIDLGIDGFRVDASNHLEKNWDFPNAKPGYEHFSSLPKHHDYLTMLGTELFKPNNIMTIGESGGASRKEALQYAGFDSNEFDLLIQFEHCWKDTDDTNTLTPGKWAKGPLRLDEVKASFNHWFDVFKDKGWNVIYWHNHDMPRIVSHYGDDSPRWHARSAKMLAYTLYMMPGTPIVYQGEEIGMTNVDYQELGQFRDVEVYTEYKNFIRNGASHDTAMQALRDRSRDNARAPMQWNHDAQAGFSSVTPWMPVTGNYTHINVNDEAKQPNSILHTYKHLLSLRKQANIAFGSITFIDIDHPDSFMYTNETDDATYLVLANFKQKTLDINHIDLTNYTLIMHNCDILEDKQLGPYEARIYKK